MVEATVTKSGQLTFETKRVQNEMLLSAVVDLEVATEDRKVYSDQQKELNKLAKAIRDSKDDINDALIAEFGPDPADPDFPNIQTATKLLVNEQLVLEVRPSTRPESTRAARRVIGLRARTYDAGKDGDIS